MSKDIELSNVGFNMISWSQGHCATLSPGLAVSEATVQHSVMVAKVRTSALLMLWATRVVFSVVVTVP